MRLKLCIEKSKVLISIIIMAILATSSLVANGTQAQAIKGLIANRTSAPANTAIMTYHNDNMRTGQNTNETILNTSNVNTNTFGRRVSYPVDGQIYAQPLFVPNVQVNNRIYNIVYIATENDSVYAFDADQTTASGPLWQTSFINPVAGITAVPAQDLYGSGSQDIKPVIGITGTPVIDQLNGTLYVVAFTKENGSYIQRLHALDITTGQDKTGSPLTIQAIVAGSGYDNVNGIVSFNPATRISAQPCLLLNGNVYIDWASFGDLNFYHGWLMGYTFKNSALQQVSAGIYNDTPNGNEGGIWMGGGGPAADANGNIYISTGNGTFDMNRQGGDAGNSIVKLSTQNGLHINDYFSPFNQSCLNSDDMDLGSSGVLLLPDQQSNSIHHNLLIEISKEGRVYVADRNNMGQFTDDPQLQCGTAEENRTDIDHIVQELPPNTTGGLFGSMGFWAGSSRSRPFVYTGGATDKLRAFSVNGSGLSAHSGSNSSENFSITGTTPSIQQRYDPSHGHRMDQQPTTMQRPQLRSCWPWSIACLRCNQSEQ